MNIVNKQDIISQCNKFCGIEDSGRKSFYLYDPIKHEEGLAYPVRTPGATVGSIFVDTNHIITNIIISTIPLVTVMKYLTESDLNVLTKELNNYVGYTLLV